MYDFTMKEKEDLYLDVVKHWGKDMNPAELAEKWNVKKSLIQGIVSRLRKKGIPMPRLGIQGFLNDERVNMFKQAFDNR